MNESKEAFINRYLKTLGEVRETHVNELLSVLNTDTMELILKGRIKELDDQRYYLEEELQKEKESNAQFT